MSHFNTLYDSTYKAYKVRNTYKNGINGTELQDDFNKIWTETMSKSKDETEKMNNAIALKNRIEAEMEENFISLVKEHVFQEDKKGLNKAKCSTVALTAKLAYTSTDDDSDSVIEVSTSTIVDGKTASDVNTIAAETEKTATETNKISTATKSDKYITLSGKYPTPSQDKIRAKIMRLEEKIIKLKNPGPNEEYNGSRVLELKAEIKEKEKKLLNLQRDVLKRKRRKERGRPCSGYFFGHFY